MRSASPPSPETRGGPRTSINKTGLSSRLESRLRVMVVCVEAITNVMANLSRLQSALRLLRIVIKIAKITRTQARKTLLYHTINNHSNGSFSILAQASTYPHVVPVLSSA